MMAEKMANELESRWHRRLVFVAFVRAVLIIVVLVVVYYLLPMDEPLGATAAARLVISLTVFAGVVAWEMRSIVRAKYPGLRAGAAVSLSATLFLLIFASTYFIMSSSDPRNFSQNLSKTDALYFTITTFSTVGFGDITATSQLARSTVMIQMILDLLILGFGLRAFLGAVQIGKERQATATDGGPGPE